MIPPTPPHFLETGSRRAVPGPAASAAAAPGGAVLTAGRPPTCGPGCLEAGTRTGLSPGDLGCAHAWFLVSQAGLEKGHLFCAFKFPFRPRSAPL